jgi:hypothetical protein
MQSNETFLPPVIVTIEEKTTSEVRADAMEIAADAMGDKNHRDNFSQKSKDILSTDVANTKKLGSAALGQSYSTETSFHIPTDNF